LGGGLLKQVSSIGTSEGRAGGLGGNLKSVRVVEKDRRHGLGIHVQERGQNWGVTKGCSFRIRKASK